mmetsp:Transcript_13653/g.16585  ORF Transcript_13653/g.16585 Transcript_13653/m.16585 type:complete len:125 (+) Transcript_13653:1626-2000(+)
MMTMAESTELQFRDHCTCQMETCDSYLLNIGLEKSLLRIQGSSLETGARAPNSRSNVPLFFSSSGAKHFRAYQAHYNQMAGGDQLCYEANMVSDDEASVAEKMISLQQSTFDGITGWDMLPLKG